MPLPVTRRSFLGGLLGGLALAPRATLAAGSDDRLLLMIMASGGWDVTYTFDPKPGIDGIAGPEVDLTSHPADREQLATINQTRLLINQHKRPAVTDFFKTWGQRTAVVNGIWVGAIGHSSCRLRVLTGTADGTRPDTAVIAGHELVGGRPLGSVDFSGFGYNGELAVTNGRMGARGQVLGLTERAASLPHPDGRAPVELPEATMKAIEARTERRTSDLYDRFGASTRGARQLDDLSESIVRARQLLSEGLPLDRLANGVEATTATLGLTAIDLLEQGVCRSVMMDSGFQWDTHLNTAPQHDYYEGLFTDLSLLVQTLHDRGLLDRVMVCVVSEMTRTPLLNALGGKDHWPHTSALFIGGGVVGGRVRGATDDSLESLPMDLATGEVDPSGQILRYDNLAAGILDHLGIDTEPWFPGTTPFRGLSV